MSGDNNPSSPLSADQLFVSVCDASSTTSSLKLIPKKKKKPSPFKPPPVPPNQLVFLQHQLQLSHMNGHKTFNQHSHSHHLDHFIQGNHLLPESLVQPLSLPIHIGESPSPASNQPKFPSSNTHQQQPLDLISVSSSLSRQSGTSDQHNHHLNQSNHPLPHQISSTNGSSSSSINHNNHFNSHPQLLHLSSPHAHYDVNSVYASFNPYVTTASLGIGTALVSGQPTTTSHQRMYCSTSSTSSGHQPPPPPVSRRPRLPPPPSASFLDSHLLVQHHQQRMIQQQQQLSYQSHHQEIPLLDLNHQQHQQHLLFSSNSCNPYGSVNHLPHPIMQQQQLTPSSLSTMDGQQPSPATTTSQLSSSRTGSHSLLPPSNNSHNQTVNQFSSRPKCSYCASFIIDEECTEAEGGVYHIKCFSCTSCRTPLGGLQYIMHPTSGGNNGTAVDGDDCDPDKAFSQNEERSPYCTNCFDQLFGEYCEGCGQLIHVAKGSAITHEGRSWHASPDCFNCHFCRKSLLGLPFLPHSSGFIYCSIQCSKDEASLHNSIRLMARAGIHGDGQGSLKRSHHLSTVKEEGQEGNGERSKGGEGGQHPSPQPNSSDSGCPSAESSGSGSSSVSHSPAAGHPPPPQPQQSPAYQDQQSTEVVCQKVRQHDSSKSTTTGDQVVVDDDGESPPSLPSCDPPPLPSSSSGEEEQLSDAKVQQQVLGSDLEECRGKDNEGFVGDEDALRDVEATATTSPSRVDDHHHLLDNHRHPSSPSSILVSGEEKKKKGIIKKDLPVDDSSASSSSSFPSATKSSVVDAVIETLAEPTGNGDDSCSFKEQQQKQRRLSSLKTSANNNQQPSTSTPNAVVGVTTTKTVSFDDTVIDNEEESEGRKVSRVRKSSHHKGKSSRSHRLRHRKSKHKSHHRHRRHHRDDEKDASSCSSLSSDDSCSTCSYSSTSSVTSSSSSSTCSSSDEEDGGIVVVNSPVNQVSRSSLPSAVITASSTGGGTTHPSQVYRSHSFHPHQSLHHRPDIRRQPNTACSIQ